MKLYSECCDSPQMGEVEDYEGELIGICIQCGEYAVFYEEEMDGGEDWGDQLEYMVEHQ